MSLPSMYADELVAEADVIEALASEASIDAARAAKATSYDATMKSRNRGRQTRGGRIALRAADGRELVLEEWAAAAAGFAHRTGAGSATVHHRPGRTDRAGRRRRAGRRPPGARILRHGRAPRRLPGGALVRPLLLLDVDGVLNALADDGEREDAWPQWRRSHATAGELRRLFGLPHLVVAGTFTEFDLEGSAVDVDADAHAAVAPSAPDPLSGRWWKYDVSRRVLDRFPGCPVIWLDDEPQPRSPFRRRADEQPLLRRSGRTRGWGCLRMASMASRCS
jgi:hypothetical protein